MIGVVVFPQLTNYEAAQYIILFIFLLRCLSFFLTHTYRLPTLCVQILGRNPFLLGLFTNFPVNAIPT